MAGYERPDYWTVRAKKEGYPARSVYKLEEIVHKFGLFEGSRRAWAQPARGRRDFLQGVHRGKPQPPRVPVE